MNVDAPEPRDSLLLRRQMILVVHFLLCLWTFAISAICFSVPAIYALRGACCLFTFLAGWLVVSWVWTGERILSLYLLFLAAVLVFNGGQICLYAFDPTTTLMMAQFRPETSLKAILLVTQSVMFLHLGALLAKRKQRIGVERSGPLDGKSASQAGWYLLALSAIPTIITLRTAIQNVMLHGYMFLFQAEKATGVEAAPQRIALLLLPATFLIFAGSGRKRWVRLFCVATVLLCSGVQLFLGTRGSAVTGLVAFAWLWEMCVGKISRPAMAVSALSCFLLLPIIGVIRDVKGDERTSFTFLVDALDKIDNPATALLSEMGNSMRTVGHTLEYVPALREYDWGTSYMYAALAVLPNVFGGPLHPAMVHGDFSDWLVTTAEPAVAAMGGGMGFSLIAEGYANFGWFGALAVMLIYGIAIQSIANWVHNSPQPGRLAVAASLISFLLFFARGESMDTIRPLIWYGALPYALVQWVRRRQQRRLELAG